MSYDRRAPIEHILHDFQLPGTQAKQHADLVRRQLTFDQRADDGRGADRYVHPKLLHNGLVLGVFYTRDGLGHAELELGDFAADQVVLVMVGDGYEHIAALGPGLLQHAVVGTITQDYWAIELSRDHAKNLRVGFHHGDLVALFEQGSSQVVAHLAPAHDNHVIGSVRGESPQWHRNPYGRRTGRLS